MSDNPVELAELVQRAAYLKVISAFTEARYDEARAQLSKRMNRGDRLIARSPLDDSKVGAVYVTDPKPTCRITDATALRVWMFQHYPELCESGYQVIGSDKEVIDVLFEHAPHLLRRVQQVSSDALRELKAASVALGQPVGPGCEADVPGLEVHTPDPVVACKPTDTALQSVMDLYRTNRLGLDGTVRELEGA